MTTRIRVGVVRFPGSNCEQDVLECFNDPEWSQAYSVQAHYLWHQSGHLDPSIDWVILPGGFSYGDTLRSGALASLSPIMRAIHDHARQGKPVLGICNGFQMLVESGLLPGGDQRAALQPNRQGAFLCENVSLTVENTNTLFTQQYRPQQVITLPIAHAEGNFICDNNTLQRLEEEQQVVFRYTGDVNGSMNQIAGICNPQGNVLGLMPHPERALTQTATHSADGQALFQSVLSSLYSRVVSLV
ncbi:MAG: phosphoribosylformylglycinamidine synthase subunit PurQ [Vampirovibrionales bacterium]